MTPQEIENINMFIDQMTQVTVRIVKRDSSDNIIGMASGFLYQPDEDYLPIVITAGHKTPEKGCFIETTIRKDGQPLCVNAGEFTVFYSHKDVDYAYSHLPIDLIKRDIEGIANVEIITYRHKFVKAKKKEAYGFAVWNDYEFVKMGNTLSLPRYCCYEVGLTLVKQDEHINYFETARPIQDHEYYRGASGSPVADPEGKITGILIGGTDPIEHLRVFRLDNIDLPTNKL